MNAPGDRGGWIRRWLPGVRQLRGYPRDALRPDAFAGVAVAIVMIPSVLAYSELVGVAPELGLYAALGSMVGYARCLPPARSPRWPRATLRVRRPSPRRSRS